MATDDFKAHEKTYAGFQTLLKTGTAVSALIALIVVLLIAR